MDFDRVCYGWVLMGFGMGGFRWFEFVVGLGLGLSLRVVRTVGFFFFGGVHGRRGWCSSNFQWW